MKLFTYVIENFMSDGGAMMGVVPKSIWSQYIEADENNLVSFALRSLVVQTDDRIILVDNGIGNKQSARFLKYLYIHGGEGLTEGLQSRGIQPAEVTDMVLTHLHFDHCGGGVYRDPDGKLLPTFPNARYWVSRSQWENALNPNPREGDAFLEENLLPMRESGVLNLVDSPMALCPEVEFRFANGHTPGQIIPMVFDGNQTFVFGADLIPTHLHIPIKYNMAYDLEVVQTMKEKEALLREIVDGQYILIFEHDAQYEACTVKHTDKGFRMDQPVSL